MKYMTPQGTFTICYLLWLIIVFNEPIAGLIIGGCIGLAFIIFAYITRDKGEK